MPRKSSKSRKQQAILRQLPKKKHHPVNNNNNNNNNNKSNNNRSKSKPSPITPNKNAQQKNQQKQLPGKSKQLFMKGAQEYEKHLEKEWKNYLNGLHQLRQQREDNIDILVQECEKAAGDLAQTEEYNKMIMMLDRDVDTALQEFVKEMKETLIALGRSLKGQKQILLKMINKSPFLRIAVDNEGRKGKVQLQSNEGESLEGKIRKKRKKNSSRRVNQSVS